MIDHITFGVADFRRSIEFYDLALAPLNIKRMVNQSGEQSDGVSLAGYGNGRPQLWLVEERATTGLMHIALQASSPAMVDAFHRAALRAGGTDNGRPGLRPHYHPGYYAAFVLDPDGHNIEAVCHVAGS